MNVFKAIFNGWIRPRMEYQAGQVVSAAEEAARAGKPAPPAEPESDSPENGPS